MSQFSDTKSQSTRKLPRPIRAALSRLRRQIRRFVLIEGLAIVVSWVCVSFWLTYAVDYFPVWFGFNELPTIARAMILGIVILVAGWILVRLIFSRLFVKLKDQSMALLLERKFPEFDESLVTTVQSAEMIDDQSVDLTMLEATQAQAERIIKTVNTDEVINSSGLNKSLITAGLLILSVAVFAFARPADIKLAGQRFYLLENRTWPRQCNLEVIGIKVKRENLVEGIGELGQIIPLTNDEFRVAKGSSLTLLVRAETADGSPSINRKLPASCSIVYRTQDGNRGQQPLKRIGSPKDGYQLYSIDSQPLQGILTDIRFSIRGGDHRVGPYTIKAVDSPTVVETKLDCVFPNYMVDNESMRWTPRTIDWIGHSQLPQGTKVTIKSKSNKPLAKVYSYDLTTRSMETITPTGDSFVLAIDQLLEPENIQFYLCDTDGIVSEQPHSVSIQPIEDQPPVVQTTLDGIGTAVTPDVKIPIGGKIEDDYGVARQWVSVFTPVSVPIVEDFETFDGKIQTEIDFKERRQRSKNKIELPTGVDDQLELLVQAQDRFDLRESANIGLGDRYVLDIVSPGELLRILERLEVGQRRRLEQVYTEVTDARGYLVRSKSERNDTPMITEPGEEAVEANELEDKPIRRDEMRLLFAQRAELQIEKSVQEILGIAFEFESIRKQLINNRVDSADRKERLSEQIVAPLRLIANESMQQLQQRITMLESSLRGLPRSAPDDSDTADELSIKSIEQIDVVLSQLDQVLSVLVKYETQNELLDIVRQMIKQQTELNERTSEENKKRAFDSLLDLD